MTDVQTDARRRLALECCTDGTCPTCAPMMAWTDYRKDYQPRDTVTASKAFFAGWEASREYHRDTPEPELVFEPCACKEVTLARGQLEKVTDSRYRRTTHYRECCNVVSPIPKPEPVPEWREWVTAQHDEVVGSRASALEDVLMCLSEVERGASKNYALARIVARCEREIGDGWQADPSRTYPTVWTVGWLMLPMSSNQWTLVGDRAAAWLLDLTEEQS